MFENLTAQDVIQLLTNAPIAIVVLALIWFTHKKYMETISRVLDLAERLIDKVGK